MRKKLISIDLDCVLISCHEGCAKKEIPPIRDGAREFIVNLAKEYDIEIFTARSFYLTIQWIMKHDLNDYIHSVSSKKNPRAAAILDDSGMNFEASYLDDTLKNFAPCWQEKKKILS